LIKLIILAALVYFGFNAAKKLILSGSNPKREGVGNSASEIEDIMVKDPYCKSYFPRRNGIHLHFNGEDLYFCSPECKDNFLKDKQHQ